MWVNEKFNPDWQNENQDNLNNDIDWKIWNLAKNAWDWIKNKAEDIKWALETENRLDSQEAKNETFDELNSLKEEFKYIYSKESPEYKINQEKLQAQNQIISDCISQKELLKQQIEEERFKWWYFSKKDLILWKYVSDKLIENINNPTTLIHQLQWFWFGIAETLAICAKLWKDALIWVKNSPKDFIQLVSWKANYNDWINNI